jgi:hypothetical protein
MLSHVVAAQRATWNAARIFVTSSKSRGLVKEMDMWPLADTDADLLPA